MRIAIIGGGPAGSFLAHILSKEHFSVTLFHIEKEKPCGGGLTYRSLKEWTALKMIEERANKIDKVKMISPSGMETEMILPQPIFIFQRRDLDRFFLSQARDSGACIIEEQVIDFFHSSPGWIIKTAKGSHGSFHFMVGADGASGLSRKKLTHPFQRMDLTQTAGYTLKEATDQCIRLKFYENMEGYAWSFPRKNNIHVGIGSPLGQKNPKDLVMIVRQFMKRYLPHVREKKKEFFSALIPSINLEEVDQLKRISEKDWALIGDAAGITDPITREGIYYAIRTAGLLSEALIKGQPQSYPSLVKKAFGKDLSWAYKNRTPFFQKELIDAVIEACRKREEVSSMISEVFCGTLPYRNLFSKLLSLSITMPFPLMARWLSSFK